MKLLFVCTGNTCRSPMAAAITRRMAAERGMRDLQVASAGVGATEGAPASDGALLVSLEQGLDLNEHRSRPLSPAMVAEADLILAMGSGHVERVGQLGGAAKVHLLGDYASGERAGRQVRDPFGADLSVYRETYGELESEIGRVLDRLAAERGPGGR